ncbi:MAG TPA: plastocyanin/azurin family copper-binding protein [Acidimicrobiales bacterium]
MSVGVALAAMSLVLGLVPVPARAVAPTVVATANFRYLPGEVIVIEGGSVTLANLEHASHDVTADETTATGAPIFASQSIGQGTTPVVGVEDLDPGVYTFFCTVHPSMLGLLNVQEAPAG